jgi:hypothetical protein
MGRQRASSTVLAVLLVTAGLAAPGSTDDLDTLLTSLLEFPARSAEELRHEVAELGGVPFVRPVPVEFLEPPAARARLEALFEAEYPKDDVAIDARLLAALDLLPSRYDLGSVRLALVLDNAVGFYDDRPGAGRLFVVGRSGRLTPSAQMIAVHELRHAQQDQHAPIHDALPAAVGTFDDRRLAYMSLLEGDALLVMERFLRSRARGGDPDLSGLMPAGDLPNVPPVLAAQLLAPYAAGRAFVDALQKARGWSAVRDAWSRPPSSTEQVLHPERFLRGEEPRPLRSGRRPPPGGRLLRSGVLGELLTRTLVGPGAEAAAEGWGGDDVRLWETAAGDVVSWRSVWDTPEDRAELVAALHTRFAAAHAQRDGASGCLAYGAGERAWALCDDGVQVELLSAPTATLAEVVRRR